MQAGGVGAEEASWLVWARWAGGPVPVPCVSMALVGWLDLSFILHSSSVHSSPTTSCFTTHPLFISAIFPHPTLSWCRVSTQSINNLFPSTDAAQYEFLNQTVCCPSPLSHQYSVTFHPLFIKTVRLKQYWKALFLPPFWGREVQKLPILWEKKCHLISVLNRQLFVFKQWSLILYSPTSSL